MTWIRRVFALLTVYMGARVFNVAWDVTFAQANMLAVPLTGLGCLIITLIVASWLWQRLT